MGIEPLQGVRNVKSLQKLKLKGLDNFKRGFIQIVQKLDDEEGVKIN